MKIFFAWATYTIIEVNTHGYSSNSKLVRGFEWGFGASRMVPTSPQTKFWCDLTINLWVFRVGYTQNQVAARRFGLQPYSFRLTFFCFFPLLLKANSHYFLRSIVYSSSGLSRFQFSSEIFFVDYSRLCSLATFLLPLPRSLLLFNGCEKKALKSDPNWWSTREASNR